MQSLKITPEQVKAFQEDGYLFIRSLFTGEEIRLIYETSTEDEAIRQHSYDLLDRQGNKTKLAMWYTPGDDVFGMLSRCSRMADTVEALLGGPVAHFHSKVMQKEPRVGGAWEWHQDYGYWYKNGFLFPDMLSVYVALTPATKENGCLQVIKGSHKMGRIGHGNSGEQVGADMERVEQCLAIREKIYCEMQPGDALFFHSNLLHTSAANHSEHPRWSIISAYNLLANVPYKENQPSCTQPLQKVPDEMILKTGKKGLDTEVNQMSQKKNTSKLQSN
ncbi:phytanoyl-CoA dioxygenase family protein [Compostibacter hankyongensis]|uniref:Phytanoyl-CoA dioxygenase family protein n=1 Tax=Compostibacter hankyongensis TaxID=1007089 RepID=A0ABP8FHM1_9BACT